MRSQECHDVITTLHQLHSTAPAWECTRLTVPAARPSLAARASTRRLPPRARPRDERPRDRKACSAARGTVQLCRVSICGSSHSRIRRLARGVCLLAQPRPRRIEHVVLGALLLARAVQNVPVLAQVESQPRGQRRRLARATGRHWRCPFVSRLCASAAARRQPGEYGGHGVWWRWWRRRLPGAGERAGGCGCVAVASTMQGGVRELGRAEAITVGCGARIARSSLVRGLRIGSLHGALSLSLGRDPSAALQHVPCLTTTRASAGGLASPAPREPPATAALA